MRQEFVGIDELSAIWEYIPRNAAELECVNLRS